MQCSLTNIQTLFTAKLYFFNAVFLLILTSQISARIGYNALQTGTSLEVQSVLRQLRGPGTESPPTGPIRAELISLLEISFVTKYRVAAGKHVGLPHR